MDSFYYIAAVKLAVKYEHDAACALLNRCWSKTRPV